MNRYWFTAIILLLSVAFMNPHNMLFIFTLAMISGVIIDLKALRPLLRWKFLFFLGILVFGTPLFIGSRQSSFLGIPYSADILRMSANMALRSVIILMAIKIFTNHISIEQMSNWLKRVRLKNFSEVFATSMKMMPKVKEISLQTFEEFRHSPKNLNMFSQAFTWTAKLIARLLFFVEDSVIE